MVGRTPPVDAVSLATPVTWSSLAMMSITPAFKVPPAAAPHAPSTARGASRLAFSIAPLTPPRLAVCRLFEGALLVR
jgi:hypothetical protein